MKKTFCYLIFVIILTACSTGKKAFQHGDYFGAVRTAVERLRSNPEHKKSAQVLESSYPMAIRWAQNEIDLALTGNDPLKWDKTVKIMQQVNELSALIRLCPAALKITPDPKIYSTEMNTAYEKAAEETYQRGLLLMKNNTRDAAREAFNMFRRSDELIPGFKETKNLISEAKIKGTLHVLVESIPVYSAMFQLSSEFFYDQIFEYLHNQYPEQGFIMFYMPGEYEESQIGQPDMLLHLEFFDFMVGNQQHSESEKEVAKTVKINPKDTVKNETVTYKAKIKMIEDKVISGGIVELRITDFPSGRLLVNDRIPGEFVWINKYAIYVGDKEALTDEQMKLTKNKVSLPPPAQTLFVEFTKPIYQQLTGKIDFFFKDYK